MDKREQMIRLWFSMWLEKKDLGMDDIFAENVSYTESWGPCYSNRETVKHWFQEWNISSRSSPASGWRRDITATCRKVQYSR